jgi:hypothetical protein
LLVTIDFVKRHAKIILVCLFILRTQAWNNDQMKICMYNVL